MPRIHAQWNIASRLRPGEDTLWIPLVLGDIFVHPLHDEADILRRIVPGFTGAALHVHADHAVLDGPDHDVVVEGLAVGAALLFVAGAAREIDQHRAVAATFLGLSDIEDILRVGSER